MKSFYCEILLLFGSIILEGDCRGVGIGQFIQFRREDSGDSHIPELYNSREAQKSRYGTGTSKGGLNFWQFSKRTSEEQWTPQNSWNQDGGRPSGGWGWSSQEDQRRPQSDKTSIVIQIPSSIAKLFRKKNRKSQGRGRGMNNRRPPPHEPYAPAFISYGPIYGEPPSNVQENPPTTAPVGMSHRIIATTQPNYGSQGKGSRQPSQSPPSWTSSSYGAPPTSSYNSIQTEISTYNAPSSSRRPQSSYGPPPSQSTTPFPIPLPTYGPTVRIKTQPPRNSYGPPQSSQNSYGPPQPTQNSYGPPQQSSSSNSYDPPQSSQNSYDPPQTKSHYSNSNRPPTRYQPPSQWESPNQSERPTLTIEQSQEYGPPVQRQPERTSPTYIPPTQSTSQPPPGWTSWNSRSQPQNQYQSSSSSWQNQPSRQQQRQQIPMNYGPPMQNFGPPKSSYGQPPPIIGDAQPNRYAPKDDIYRYPTNDQPNQNSGQQQQQPYDHYNVHIKEGGYDSAASEQSEEFYVKPSKNQYQLPNKPYREPNRRKNQNRFQEDCTNDHERNGHFQSPSHYNGNRIGRPSTHYSGKRTIEVDALHHDPNARPPPNFDTNYNSPGFSKDPKIVDWMPYSAKNYHEIPGKKKRKTLKYKTLPDSLHNYRPDPEHEKYPKLTYDSLTDEVSRFQYRQHHPKLFLDNFRYDGKREWE